MSVLSSKYSKPHDVSSRCTYYKRSLHWHGHVGSAMYLIGSESLTLASSEQRMATKDPIMQFEAFLQHNNIPPKPNFQSSRTSCVANAAAATARLHLHPVIKLESRTKFDAPIQEGSRALGMRTKHSRTNRHVTWQRSRALPREQMRRNNKLCVLLHRLRLIRSWQPVLTDGTLCASGTFL